MRTVPELVEALSSPEVYDGASEVRVCETHASWVFLTGDRAYKVKKPLSLPFLDYGTLARRREACREEVHVNRELAPELYIGVRAIVARDGGLRLAEESAPDAVEYAVEMVRFEESHTLAAAIGKGQVAHGHLRDVARRLARFHARAPGVAGGDPEMVLAQWSANASELARMRHPAQWHTEGLTLFASAFVQTRAAEIERRRHDGHVRDGHGDLRCEHILVEPAVRVVDRIEFDPRLRHGDVARDLAFLTMDLELRRARWAVRELVAAYRRAGGSPGGEALRSFYAAHWALVRAKVALLRGGQGEQAQRLWDLAERLCWRARRPLAIVVCGPAASGKSTLAAALSRRSGMPVVSSDEMRKRAAGVPATSTARAEHYSSSFTHLTYDAVSREAQAHLRRRDGVIVDATCRTRGQRALLCHRLAIAGTLPVFAYCRLPLEAAVERARRRTASAASISDATPEVVAEHYRTFQQLEELPLGWPVSVDTERPVDEQLAALARAVDERLGAPIRALPKRFGAFIR